MTILRLTDILGESIEALHKFQEGGEGFELAIKKAEHEAKLAKQIINGADITLRADKLSQRNDRIDKVVG